MAEVRSLLEMSLDSRVVMLCNNEAIAVCTSLCIARFMTASKGLVDPI